MYLCTCLSVYIYLSICLLLFIGLSVYQFYRSIYPYLYINLSIYLYVYLSTSQSTYMRLDNLDHYVTWLYVACTLCFDITGHNTRFIPRCQGSTFFLIVFEYVADIECFPSTKMHKLE